MKSCAAKTETRKRYGASGFTLAETVMAVLAAGLMLLALYASFTCGYAILRVSREDTRATQILLQKMEAIRLAPYDQVANPAYFGASTTAYYDEKDQPAGNGGTVYTVNFMTTTNLAALPSTYKPDVMLVTVWATWNSGNAQRSRTNKTYVARNGIQNYVAAH